MEFNEKLLELRKKKGLTQEELAEILFVSRTAVSKWESGRGYPNIDSLKAIAKYFEVSIDALLSGEELLTLAEENTKEKETRFCDLIFGLLDCSAAMFFFLPFFGQKTDTIEAVSILSLTHISPYLKTAYWIVILAMIGLGILTLALQTAHPMRWGRSRRILSLVWNAIGAFVFIISSQPYAAALLFVFLLMKVLILLKGQ